MVDDSLPLRALLRDAGNSIAAANAELPENLKARIAQLEANQKLLVTALEFYADESKWFVRESEVDLNQTSAIFNHEYQRKTDLTKPNLVVTKVRECTARIKIDQGNTARVALESVKA